MPALRDAIMPDRRLPAFDQPRGRDEIMMDRRRQELFNQVHGRNESMLGDRRREFDQVHGRDDGMLDDRRREHGEDRGRELDQVSRQQLAQARAMIAGHRRPELDNNVRRMNQDMLSGRRPELMNQDMLSGRRPEFDEYPRRDERRPPAFDDVRRNDESIGVPPRRSQLDDVRRNDADYLLPLSQRRNVPEFGRAELDDLRRRNDRTPERRARPEFDDARRRNDGIPLRAEKRLEVTGEGRRRSESMGMRRRPESGVDEVRRRDDPRRRDDDRLKTNLVTY